MSKLPAGTVRREDGVLEKSFTVRGRTHRVTAETLEELVEAEQILRERLAKEARSQESQLTLDQYFELWIVRRGNTAKDASIYRYRRQYRTNLSPRLGRRRLTEISRGDVFALQQELAGLYHPNTANYIVRLLQSILADAAREELIPANPGAGISALKYRMPSVTRSFHRALTVEEQNRFMRAARASFYYEFFAILLLTGMRYGEAAALTWGDIDLDAGLIRIDKSISCNTRGQLITSTTKTFAGEREIPLTGPAVQILAGQRDKLKNRFGHDAADPEKPVFVSERGKVLHNRTANLNLQAILKDMAARGEGIDHFTLHALRDTFATRFIEQGGNPQTLKALLGHSQLGITMDLYSQVLPDTKKQEMEKLEIEV